MTDDRWGEVLKMALLTRLPIGRPCQTSVVFMTTSRKSGMPLYELQFSEELDVRQAPKPKTTILIASTPRSGSHMLGHSMLETDRLGRPFEYCNPVNLDEWKRRLGLTDTHAVMRELMARRTTPNGIFSVKMHFEHLEVLGGLERVLELFPDVRVVRIVRSDVVRQAVSLAIAQQTGVWISGQGNSGAEATYSYWQIRRALDQLLSDNYEWSKALRGAGISPMTVEFDEVRSNTTGVIRNIAEHAGVDASTLTTVQSPPTRKQSTPRSDDWCGRFLEQDAKLKNLQRGVERIYSKFVLPRRANA
ncbi:Stf0 family sulfotransferase [Consotaella aegiceratis]|uniref:Stf0 family sulfotransferase n=1 Tax=Consotaella aegiceratis TaxID=3097961 RepID=UPI002F3E35A1